MLCRVLCALIFVAWTEETKWWMYEGLWKSPLQILNPIVSRLPIVRLSPWQLMLSTLVPVCLLWRGGLRQRSFAMDAAVLTSLTSVGLTFLWGMARGGSAYAALLQLEAFLTALLVGTVLFSVVRTPSDLRALGLTVVMAALTRSTLVIYFYFAHVRGKIDPPPSFMTCHEDSLLFVAALLVALSWALARRTWTAWMAGGLASAYVLWAVTLNARRLAWLELLFAMGFTYVLLPRGALRRHVSQALLFGGPVIVLYIFVGWGRPETVFEPVRALSTVGSDEDASSLARLEETRNLVHTLTETGNPLLGTGWGRPYWKATSAYANFSPEWWEYLYMPHNSLLAVAAFGGLAGLFGMWLVVPVTALLGTRGYLRATGPVERAAGMTAVCFLPAFGVQCYGDIGLQQLPCTLIFGVAMAVAARVSVWSDTAPKGAAGPRGAA